MKNPMEPPNNKILPKKIIIIILINIFQSVLKALNQGKKVEVIRLEKNKQRRS